MEDRDRPAVFAGHAGLGPGVQPEQLGAALRDGDEYPNGRQVTVLRLRLQRAPA